MSTITIAPTYQRGSYSMLAENETPLLPGVYLVSAELDGVPIEGVKWNGIGDLVVLKEEHQRAAMMPWQLLRASPPSIVVLLNIRGNLVRMSAAPIWSQWNSYAIYAFKLPIRFSIQILR